MEETISNVDRVVREHSESAFEMAENALEQAETALDHAVDDFEDSVRSNSLIQKVQHLVWWVFESISRYYKMTLAIFLKNLAYVGLNLEMEVDALGEDFVQSDTFLKYVNDVFDECDVDGDGYLEGGEFFAAVLLLYHQFNKIPFSGRKSPPARQYIVRMFEKYTNLQQSEMLLKELENKGKNPSENNETWYRQKKRGKRVRKFFVVLLQQMVFAATLIFGYEYARNMLCADKCADTGQHPTKINRTIAATIVSTACVTVFSFSGLLYSEARESLADRRKENTTKDLLKTKSTETIKGEKEKLYSLNREYFVELCQDHFQYVVASEGWRLLAHAVLVPFVAIRLKALVFSIPLVRNVFSRQHYFSEDLVAGILVTLILTLFPFVEAVVQRLMWSDYADEEQLSARQRKRRSRRRRHVLDEDFVPAEVKKLEKNRRKKKKQIEIRRSVNRYVGLRVFESQPDLSHFANDDAKKDE
mmetsp:Transcript_5039/g.5716  ORF Transcript_5039/g.5716 Transcript_5039/m.5716 type:complete len:474 (-) Transcript_5039:782-2203(-)